MTHVLPMEKRVAVVNALVEGCSISSASRMTGVCRNAIARLLVLVGEGCKRLHDRLVRGLECSLIQMDELWTFVHKKERRVAPGDPCEWGDAYTYVAMSPITKLVVAYRVGKRDQPDADAFLLDVRARLTTIPEIVSDAFPCYEKAVSDAFGGSVDYAQVIKSYSRSPRRSDGPRREDHRYEPPRNPFITRRAVMGAPDPRHMSTSLIERQNWTIRGGLRRLTRLSNGFSHKRANLEASVALWFAYYNLVRIHETIRCTPAMEAGVADRVWSLAELVEAALAEPAGGAPAPEPLKPRAGQGPSRTTVTGKVLRLVTAPQQMPLDFADKPQPPKPRPVVAPKQLRLFDDT